MWFSYSSFEAGRGGLRRRDRLICELQQEIIIAPLDIFVRLCVCVLLLSPSMLTHSPYLLSAPPVAPFFFFFAPGAYANFDFQARVCGELVAEGGDTADEAGATAAAAAAATAERNASARDFLAVSRAGVRALASPSPGLKITPAEVRRYMESSMASIPWSS